MIYVVMCGGTYTHFGELPRHLHKVHGERLVDRTIRQLRENGAEEIYITATDPRFEDCGVDVLYHENSYSSDGKTVSGYWLDAFYPFFADDAKVTYIFGDVLFSDDAIRRIIHCQRDGNILFGTGIAKNPQHKNWGEPFAYVVNDYKTFMAGVRDVKKLQDEGKTDRVALVWELYRYLNGLDVNIQDVRDDTYVVIDDGTIDADDPERFEEWNR